MIQHEKRELCSFNEEYGKSQGKWDWLTNTNEQEGNDRSLKSSKANKGKE